jgi:mannosyltransferase OCH1-like enzyme
MGIPKIIHQVWMKVGRGAAAPPREYDTMRASWRTHHPDWTFMDWDLDKTRALIDEHYPEYLTMFDAYKRDIYRIDACRYFILHRYGGAYVDVDTTCVAPIDDLCRHRNVLCLNAYTKKFIHNNHFFLSTVRSDLMRECIHRLPTAALLQTTGDSWASTMLVAGPGLLTGAALSHRRKKDLTTLSYVEEQRYFHHHEKHSWKVGRSIAGDVVRGVVVASVVVGGVYLGKTLLNRRRNS